MVMFSLFTGHLSFYNVIYFYFNMALVFLSIDFLESLIGQMSSFKFKNNNSFLSEGLKKTMNLI